MYLRRRVLRRRRGRELDIIPWRRVAAPPRPRAGLFGGDGVAASLRGGASDLVWRNARRSLADFCGVRVRTSLMYVPRGSRGVPASRGLRERHRRRRRDPASESIRVAAAASPRPGVLLKTRGGRGVPASRGLRERRPRRRRDPASEYSRGSRGVAATRRPLEEPRRDVRSAASTSRACRRGARAPGPCTDASLRVLTIWNRRAARSETSPLPCVRASLPRVRASRRVASPGRSSGDPAHRFAAFSRTTSLPRLCRRPRRHVQCVMGPGQHASQR